MYFGSVRFFKNLILLCVLVMILIPTVFAIRNASALVSARDEAALLRQETETLRAQLEQPQAPVEPAVPLAGSEQQEEPSQPSLSPEVPAYQSLYPDFYAPQPLDAQSWTADTIYLTFDDGPTETTDRVLEVLAEKEVKATFFVIGHTDEAAKQRMRDIVEQGHTLGMHSFSHDYDAIYSSVEAFLDDMYQIFTLIRDATGVTPTVFRFPGGSLNGHNNSIHQELMAEMLRRGFVPYDWNLSAQDATARPLTQQEVLNNVFTGASTRVRGFVLLHDGSNQLSTAQSLDTIIERFQEMGFQFDCIHPDTKPILFSYPE